MQLQFSGIVLERPRVRGECAAGPRPCPWVSCRYHLYLDVVKKDQVKCNHGAKEPWELAETCALDVVRAHPDGLSQDQVAPLLGISRPRVHQNQEEAGAKIKAFLGGTDAEWDELAERLEQEKDDGDQDA